jgi:hypothetical protein
MEFVSQDNGFGGQSAKELPAHEGIFMHAGFGC